MEKLAKKASKDIKSLFKKHLLVVFESDIVPKIKEMIIEDYNTSLNDRVTNPKSRTRPEYYMDEFIDHLEEFEYIDTGEDKLSISVPDMDTFDFGGKLNVIQDILEGKAGNYVEVDMAQLGKMYNRPPRVLVFIDSSVPRKERIVTLRKTVDVLNRLRANNIPIVDYPFSNTPPIDIFGKTAEYVEKELLNESISEVLTRANKEFTKTFRA